MGDKWNWNTIIILISFALVTRVALPPLFSHPANFSGLDALALFCGAYFTQRFRAIVMVLITVWISDLLLNRITIGSWVLFYSGCYWQYLSYILISCLGFYFLKNQLRLLLPTCLLASLSFFVITNFGVWLSSTFYSQDMTGLITCYAAAIPFFKNTVFADLAFTVVLFGSFTWIMKRSFLCQEGKGHMGQKN